MRVRAFARVKRAEEHLAELIRKVAALGREQLNAITFQPHPSDPKQFQAVSPAPPIDFSFSVLIGEIVYNLRAALDYLVFETAALDSGFIVESTQFPIERNKKGFRWRIKGGWLNGLNSTHVAAIEAVQPYNGCHWTAALRDLSNIDKHVTLVPRQTEHELTVHIADRDHIGDFADMPGAVRTAVTSDGTEVYVKAVLSTTIQFSDGTPVIEALEEIKSQVARLLEAFKPDFERARRAAQSAPPSP